MTDVRKYKYKLIRSIYEKFYFYLFTVSDIEVWR